MFYVSNHYHTAISLALQYHDGNCRDDPFRAEGWFNFVPMQLGFINVDVNGHGESVYDARCWGRQLDSVTVRVVDRLTGLTATGQSSAFTC